MAHDVTLSEAEECMPIDCSLVSSTPVQSIQATVRAGSGLCVLQGAPAVPNMFSVSNTAVWALCLTALAALGATQQAAPAADLAATADASRVPQINHAILLHGKVDLPPKVDAGCSLSLKAYALRVSQGRQLQAGQAARLQATLGSSTNTSTACPPTSACITWNLSTTHPRQYLMLVPIPEPTSSTAPPSAEVQLPSSTTARGTEPLPKTASAAATSPHPRTLMSIHAAWSCVGDPATRHATWTELVADHVLEHDIQVSDLTDLVTCSALAAQNTHHVQKQGHIHHAVAQPQSTSSTTNTGAGQLAELSLAEVQQSAAADEALLGAAVAPTPPHPHQETHITSPTSAPGLHTFHDQLLQSDHDVAASYTWSDWAAAAKSQHICVPALLLAGLPPAAHHVITWATGASPAAAFVCAPWYRILLCCCAAATLLPAALLIIPLLAVLMSRPRSCPRSGSPHPVIIPYAPPPTPHVDQFGMAHHQDRPSIDAGHMTRTHAHWNNNLHQEGRHGDVHARDGGLLMDRGPGQAPARGVVRHSIQAALRASGRVGLAVMGALGVPVGDDAGQEDGEGGGASRWTRDADGRLKRFSGVGRLLEEEEEEAEASRGVSGMPPDPVW